MAVRRAASRPTRRPQPVRPQDDASPARRAPDWPPIGKRCSARDAALLWWWCRTITGSPWRQQHARRGVPMAICQRALCARLRSSLTGNLLSQPCSGRPQRGAAAVWRVARNGPRGCPSSLPKIWAWGSSHSQSTELQPSAPSASQHRSACHLRHLPRHHKARYIPAAPPPVAMDA